MLRSVLEMQTSRVFICNEKLVTYSANQNKQISDQAREIDHMISLFKSLWNVNRQKNESKLAAMKGYFDQYLLFSQHSLLLSRTFTFTWKWAWNDISLNVTWWLPCDRAATCPGFTPAFAKQKGYSRLRKWMKECIDDEFLSLQDLLGCVLVVRDQTALFQKKMLLQVKPIKV